MGSDPNEISALWQRLGWSEQARQNTAREMPAHTVRIRRGFWLYQTEVTTAQYAKYCAATGRSIPNPPHTGPSGNTLPVVNVPWYDAADYCRWVGARLPTEAEWEYAARGGETGTGGAPRRHFPWGDRLPKRNEKVGNLADETLNPGPPYFQGYRDGYRTIAPVGKFRANGYGLYDMAGNVWEWCSDWFSDTYYASSPVEDPTGPASGTERVMRGGAENSDPDLVRTAARGRNEPRNRDENVGFRPAMN